MRMRMKMTEKSRMKKNYKAASTLNMHAVDYAHTPTTRAQIQT